MRHETQEIKFLSLPRASQLEDMLERTGTEFKEGRAQIMNRYNAAQWRIYLAQRKAAVIAAEIVRPGDFKDIKSKFTERVRIAREEFEQECVNVFSETCTKGM